MLCFQLKTIAVQEEKSHQQDFLVLDMLLFHVEQRILWCKEKHHAVFFYSSNSNRTFVENSQSLSANMQTAKMFSQESWCRGLGDLGTSTFHSFPEPGPSLLLKTNSKGKTVGLDSVILLLDKFCFNSFPSNSSKSKYLHHPFEHFGCVGLHPLHLDAQHAESVFQQAMLEQKLGCHCALQSPCSRQLE